LFALRLRVHMNGGPGREVVTAPGDFVRLERAYGIKATALSEPAAEWLNYLGWSALRRTGEFAGDFEAFLEQVVDLETLEVPGQGEAAAGAPPASSPSSPTSAASAPTAS
jgi:hypothetical protein